MKIPKHGDVSEYTLDIDFSKSKKHSIHLGIFNTLEEATTAYVRLNSRSQNKMLHPFDVDYVPHLKDIDAKAYYYAWCDDRWDEASKYIFRVWSNPHPLGFAAFRFVKKDSIYIAKFAVYPEHRGKGIGTALLDDIEIIARSQSVISLFTTLHEENLLGILWAQSKGFDSIGTRKRIYRDGRDGYHFIKRLNQ